MAETSSVEDLSIRRERVLAVLNRHSARVVSGLETRLLRFRYRQLAGDDDPSDVIQALIDERWLSYSPNRERIRLTPAGYRGLLAEVGAQSESQRKQHARRPGPPSEYSLREAVLAIYRENQVAAKGHLSAEVLNRYWSVTGRRAEELRHALDLLLRDGYLRMGRFRKTLFRLQPAGADYMAGRPAPDYLQEQAGFALREERHRKVLPDDACLILAAHVFKDSRALPPRHLSFGELAYGLEHYGMTASRQFHSADLLHRYGHVDMHWDGSVKMTLTDEGRGLLRKADSEMVQWAVRMALEDVERAAAAEGRQ